MESKHGMNTLDLSKFTHGDINHQQEFSTHFTNLLVSNGYVRLVNPRISNTNPEELLKLAQSFFDLELQAKMTAAHTTTPSPHRGYSYLGQERLSSITGFADGFKPKKILTDTKETFDMGSKDDESAPNKWLDKPHLPQFQDKMESSYEAFKLILHILLGALEIGLNLPSNTLRCLHKQSHHELRLLHYPESTVANLTQDSTRTADHTDFGTLTILVQDNTGGLEGRQPKTERYFPIDPAPSELIVILGDCLQRWTGNKLWAIPHRVTLPPSIDHCDPSALVRSRLSIAFFGKPDRNATVGNLNYDSLGDIKYDAITAGAYNTKKLNMTY